MKRIHFIIAFLISFCLFIPFPVSADDTGTGFNSDDDISYIRWRVNTDGTTCTVNGYGENYWYDPVIPEEINGYKVTAIAPYAFTGIRLRGTLSLPDGLETIGEGSFAAYYDETDTAGSTIGLTGDLIIPDSVKEIGLSSFCYNEFGGRLHLPPGITQIGNSTFMHCTFSEDIVIPDSVRTIGDYAFSSGQAGQYLLTGDAKMILGKNIRVISKGAFYWCGKMEDTLILPDTVVSVGWNAFTGCRFDRVIIPPGVASIGESALSSQADSHNAYVLSDDATFLDGYALGNPYHTVIHANPGSTAEDFAAKNGQTFISLAQDGDIHAQAPCTGGHEYSKWYTTKEPTETENGTRTQICLACGSVHNETIKSLSEDVDSGVYRGMSWRVTSTYDLVLGEEGATQTYTGEDWETPHNSDYPWDEYRPYIKSVKVEGSVSCSGHLYEMFRGLSAAKTIDLTGLDTGNVTSMYGLFLDCIKLQKIDLSCLDTHNVTEMTAMLQNCTSLKSVDLSVLDTSNLESLQQIFENCQSLEIINLSGIDASKLTNTYRMFACCKSLQSVDVSSIASEKISLCSQMFYACDNLSDITLGGFSPAKADSLFEMFYGCISLEGVNLSGFDTSNVTDFRHMFDGCLKLKYLDLSSFDTSKATTFDSMFQYCESLEEVVLSSFDTSNVTDMSGMFNNCSLLTKVDVSGFDTRNVTTMKSMFTGCGVAELDLSGFDTSNLKNMNRMFMGCYNLKSLDLSSFDTSKVTDMEMLFCQCSAAEEINVSSFDTRNVVTMASMFSSCKKLKSLNLTGFDTSSVFDMTHMLIYCTSLEELDLSSFDLSDLTKAEGMLQYTKLRTLKCPKNLNLDVNLSWQMLDEDGNSYSRLPQGISESITLYYDIDSYGPYVPETPDDPTPDEPAVTKESQSVALSAKKYSKTTNSSAFNLKASAKTQLSYKSSNTKVAKVNSKGLVTITGPGKATITVTAAENSEYTSAKAKVTVNVVLHKPRLTAKNLKGKKIKLTWSQVKYADGYRIYIKGPGDKKYKLRLTKSAKVKSVTHKGLVKGKTYKYKIVAYKKVSGKTYTSAASTIRTVKVKK